MTSHDEGTDTATVAASLPAAPVEVQAEPRQAPFVMVRLVDQEELCRRGKDSMAGTLLVIWIRLNAAAMRNPEDTHFTVPYTDLTRSTRCGPNTVTRALRELERLGFVATDRRPRAATRYRLLRGAYMKAPTEAEPPTIAMEAPATTAEAPTTTAEAAPPTIAMEAPATTAEAPTTTAEAEPQPSADEASTITPLLSPRRQSSRSKTSRLKTPLEVPPSPDSATPETSGPEDRLQRILDALRRFTPPALPPELVSAARAFAACREAENAAYFAERLEFLTNPDSAESTIEGVELLTSWATPAQAALAAVSAAPMAAPPPAAPPPPPFRSRTKKEPFRPPTVAEVEEYCRQKGYTLNAELFVSWNESKGWRVGREPMKNWRAAVVTWVNRDKERGLGGSEPRRSGQALGQVVHVAEGIPGIPF